MVPVPNNSMEHSERPRPRVQDGRSKPGYGEPPAAGHRAHTREEENYPIIYGLTYIHVNPNGGSLVTIEGENLGSILSSFGEEDREGNSAIEIYFTPHRNSGSDIPTYCHEIQHYHNPTQLFCLLDRLSAGESSYTLVVKINGHKAANQCGGNNWHCQIQAYLWKTMQIADNGIRPGNLVAPSKSFTLFTG